MQQNQQMRRLMHGAWTLSIASLIAKILSAVYRVPFQNMVGDTGFYVYQQVYPLYGIGMTFALSGFPVFISKLVAEAREPDQQELITHRVLVLLTWLSAVLFLAFETGAGLIAHWMADPELASLIQTVAFMFLAMPFLASTRGFFQGTFDMTKTAISQVVEQVIRVAVILLAAWWSLRVHWSPYQMGAIAMSGAFFGGAAACLTLWRPFRRATHLRTFTWPGLATYGQLGKRLITEGGAIALFAAMVVVLQLIDSFTVTKGLMASGIDVALAKTLKGIYDRGQPLVQLGLVVATSLSATLLPRLTTAYARHQDHQFAQTAIQLLHLTMALSVAATAGLMVLMPCINWLLFGDTAGTLTLQVYVLAVGLVALINAANAILQSINRFRVTMWALGGGILVKVLLNTALVTRFGTLGAAATTILALGLIAEVLYWQLPAAAREPAAPNFFALKLTLVTAAMVLCVWGLQALVPLTSRPQAVGLTLAGIVLGVIVFVVAGSALRLFTAREMLVLPGGRRLLRLLGRRPRKD